MLLNDNFGGETNLFISGQNLTFQCTSRCPKEPCVGMAVKRNTSTIVKSDEKIPLHDLSMALTHNIEFGEYMCEANNVRSKRTLKLNYLLCKQLVLIHNSFFEILNFVLFLGDDRDHLCKSLSCPPQASNGDGDLHFCVIKENVLNPTCELDKTNCPDESFDSDSIGYPCLKNGEKGESLCAAFAKQEKVVYVSTSTKDNYCSDVGRWFMLLLFLF